MSSEEVAAWPGAHPAGSFTFSHNKWRDGSAVNSLDLTDPTGRETPNYQNDCTWQSLANEVRTGSIFWEGTKLATRKRLFLLMKFLPLHAWHTAQLQTIPSHPQSICTLTACLLGNPNMFRVHFLLAMIRKLRLSQEWQKPAPSYAKQPKKRTCRNSTFNHIEDMQKNPMMIHPMLSIKITFVISQVQFHLSWQISITFFPLILEVYGEWGEEKDSQN